MRAGPMRGVSAGSASARAEAKRAPLSTARPWPELTTSIGSESLAIRANSPGSRCAMRAAVPWISRLPRPLRLPYPTFSIPVSSERTCGPNSAPARVSPPSLSALSHSWRINSPSSPLVAARAPCRDTFSVNTGTNPFGARWYVRAFCCGAYGVFVP